MLYWQVCVRYRGEEEEVWHYWGYPVSMRQQAVYLETQAKRKPHFTATKIVERHLT